MVTKFRRISMTAGKTEAVVPEAPARSAGLAGCRVVCGTRSLSRASRLAGAAVVGRGRLFASPGIQFGAVIASLHNSAKFVTVAQVTCTKSDNFVRFKNLQTTCLYFA